MRDAFDQIIVGLGGMGSAAAYHLASRGQRVLGIDQFSPPHERGSSHGASRIIRLAYYEHPSYVPLLRRSYELWRQLERESGNALLRITGSLDASAPDGRIFAGSLASCREHGLEHEVLTSAQISARFPGYQLPDGFMGVFQPEGGMLDPERCVAAHLRLAEQRGATIRRDEEVLEVSANSVRTAKGVYSAPRVVISAGSWAARIAGLDGLAVPERQVVGWFATDRADAFAPERFPVFNIDVEEGHYYGFPLDADGVKIGRYHHRGETVDPASYDRAIHPEDEAALRPFMTRYLPRASGKMVKAQTCLFTNSPDEHFIIDRSRDSASVIVAAGFSGHGFKFCSVVGEILADLAMRGETGHHIDLFRLSRFYIA